MMWLGIIALLFILIVSYFIFAPFYLEIDSENNLVRIRFHHLASARLWISNSSLTIQVKIAGWNKEIDLFTEEAEKDKPASVKRVSKSPGVPFRKIISVLKSFKVNKCYIRFDFGNMQWNGIFFPLFFWMSRWTGKDIQINFMGENTVKLEIENNFARIILAYLHK